jgi:hypothetical protein
MEKFGICLLNLAPVRKDPSDGAEMTTQLLFGDLVQITYQHNQWCNIRQEYDNYEGWADGKQLFPLSEQNYRTIASLPTAVNLDLVNSLSNNSSSIPQLLLFGSSLPGLIKKTFYVGDIIYTFEGEYFSPDEEVTRENIVDNAYSFRGCPYLWGGKTPFGADCSGFTQVVYKASGIRLLRDTKEQATQGETLNMLQEAKPGDLAFFDNPKGNISHVGILLSENRIIHASGTVRIDSIDHEGIYNREEKRYTHKLRLIKSLL